MHDWKQVLERVQRGNPAPARRVEKSEDQWRAELAPAVFEITRHAATERPFSSEMCGLFEPGRYGCACCGEDHLRH